MTDNRVVDRDEASTEAALRDLAVEIVDFVHGYTEGRVHPQVRELDYDWVEQRLNAMVASTATTTADEKRQATLELSNVARLLIAEVEASGGQGRVDRDEHGQPVSEEYRRLGADGDQGGLYVRFEPGFGLNVYIGQRTAIFKGPVGSKPSYYEDEREVSMSIQGWERLGELVDEWRERRAARGTQGES